MREGCHSFLGTKCFFSDTTFRDGGAYFGLQKTFLWIQKNFLGIQKLFSGYKILFSGYKNLFREAEIFG